MTGGVEEEGKSLSCFKTREYVVSWKIAIFMMFKINNKMKYILWQGQAFRGSGWKDSCGVHCKFNRENTRVIYCKDAEIDRSIVESLQSTLDLKLETKTQNLSTRQSYMGYSRVL